jgi:hypothetical protein
MPANIKPIFLPSRSPELNPVENIWQYMRANWLSNRVFDHYDAIVEAACEAWKKLTQAPDTIRSIGMRDWASTPRVLMAASTIPRPAGRVAACGAPMATAPPG